MINALRKTNTKNRGRKEFKTQDVDESFISNYSRRSWPLKVDKMSIDRGRSRVKMRMAKRPAKLQDQKGKKAETGKSVVCVSNSKKAGLAS